jgi:hypothetical protein
MSRINHYNALKIILNQIYQTKEELLKKRIKHKITKNIIT